MSNRKYSKFLELNLQQFLRENNQSKHQAQRHMAIISRLAIHLDLRMKKSKLYLKFRKRNAD